jgi:hypothetical protein
MIDTLAKIWENWISGSATKQVAWNLPSTHVDNSRDYVPLAAGQHYIRVWLVEMFIRDKTKIFQTWYPAVHSRVKVNFGGEPLEIANVADSTKVGMQQDHGHGDVIARNFPMTPLLPFNADVIELDAGLVAVEGQNYVNGFIKVLSDFSSLLAVPQLSSALSVAKPLANGLQALFGAGDLHLGVHDSFTAGKTGGYYAAIRATEADVSKNSLWVADSQLRIGTAADVGQSQPFIDFDHMLFRVEVVEERDDYDMLKSVREPMRLAQDALKGGREQEAESFFRTAIVAAHQAPEFTRADRARVKLKLAEDYKEMKRDLGFSALVSADGAYSLKKSMQTALTPKAALDRGQPSFEELFAA